MFAARDLSDDLAALRDEHAPSARVVETEQEFETMPTDWLFELAIVTDELQPLAYPADWLPDDATSAARRTTDRDPAIGMPDDGSVTWTRQTEPPMVFIKPRAAGLPDEFCDFLIGEALVELGAAYPETPVCFFRERYRSVQSAVGSPTVAYQLAAALRTGWIGRETRTIFTEWADPYPGLHAGWVDAGDRLRDRVESIPTLLNTGEIAFGDATELACSAIKHDLALPAPFAAIDVEAYSEQGPEFAERWIEETAVEALE